MGRYGTLVFKIEGVTHGDLPKTDLIGDPDPYVRLSFGAENTARTEHIDGHELDDDDRPQWNQTLELDLPQDRTALHVEIHDHDPKPGTMASDDDLMAEGWIDLAPLILSWQLEPEMDAVSEHPRRVRAESDDPDVLTYAASLTTMETSLRGKKMPGGQPISLQFVVVKLEVTEPVILEHDELPRGNRTRANLAEDISVLDFACLAMSTTRSLPLREPDPAIEHPELHHPHVPKM